MTKAGLVIIGGSYAGIGIAAAARAEGYAEPIRLLCDEDTAGYHRPPLSKGFINASPNETILPLRGEGFYRDNGIELMLGTRVAAIERGERRIVTEHGETVGFDKLALATGARPRLPALEGVALDGVVALRSLADALAIRERLERVEKVVIIGAGFIGLELAATFAKAGKSVIVLEVQSRILARAICPILSNFLTATHAAHGVAIHLGTSVEAIVARNGDKVGGVRTKDGRHFDADMVVVAIGAVPNTEIAQAGGIACGDGILVDASCLTNDPDIVAAGDCTRHPSAFAGGAAVRLESVQNANDQAKVAGANVAGRVTTYASVPWFWTDQYSVKLQIVGLSQTGDEAILRGKIDDGRFSVFIFRDDHLVAVESVNKPADHMVSRGLIGGGIKLTRAEAADPSFNLSALLRAHAKAE